MNSQCALVLTTMNYLDITQECLLSLYDSTRIPFHLIVVDASDTTDTVDYISEAFPEADIIRLDSRYWVAYAWNRGIERAMEYGADYIGLLNNDITFRPGWLKPLIDTFSIQTPCPVGMVGPVVYNISGYYESPALDKMSSKVYPVHTLMGCTFLLSKQAIQNTGMVDERYLNSHDEVDYCYRLWGKGYMVMCNTTSRVIHRGGTVRQETNITEAWRAINNRYNLKVLHPYDLWQVVLRDYRKDGTISKYSSIINAWSRYY